jgi:adenosine deaminase CECR1
MAFDALGLEGLGSLARNSIEFASFPDRQCQTQYGKSRLQQWNDKWEEFCSWVVNNFGGSSLTFGGSTPPD